MKRIAVLILILVVGAILRLYMLPSLPPSLTWDEVSWGYNAYSLGTDGRDEFGKFLPLTYLESFGDYKPPVYAYLTVPFVKLLGLNELAVRIPSAALGILTIFLTYLLTKRIFGSVEDKKRETIALLSAGLLAISPWHIMLSRAAFEANVATFFIVLGVYLFLLALEKKWVLPFSVLSFAASMYTFNTARVFVPLLGVFLLVKYFKVLFKDKKIFFFSAGLGILVLFPLLTFLFTPEAQLRFREVNIFSDHSIVVKANQQIQNDNNAFWSKLIHNRRAGYALSYVEHYLDNFDPEFLFIKGDGNPKFSIQDVGQMYIWEIPFFVLGILFLLRKREGHYAIIPMWILLGIIPAGVARETPHALRIETILPTFQILTAYGIYYTFSFFNKKLYGVKALPIAVLIVSFFALFNLLYFVHNYWTHYPKEYSSEWQYGYKEAINYVWDSRNEYDNIYITEALGRPYIYLLFYSKYSPSNFRKDADVYKDAAGFTHVSKVGKFSFGGDLHENVDLLDKNLFVAEPGKVPVKSKILREFKRLDGTTVLVAYERDLTNEELK